MKKWLSYLPTIFIITILIALVSFYFQGNVKGMNYTEFQNIADSVTFKNADLDIGSTVIKVDGVYEEKGKSYRYNVMVPNTDQNLEWITDTVEKDGGTVNVSDPSAGNLWMSLLVQIIPLALLLSLIHI